MDKFSNIIFIKDKKVFVAKITIYASNVLKLLGDERRYYEFMINILIGMILLKKLLLLLRINLFNLPILYLQT